MFEGSLLKIERAKKHINDLNEEIIAYLGENPLELRIKQEATKDTWFVKTKKPIPLQLSIILGDSIHNLRASLDNLAFEMIGSKAKNLEGIYFPFCKDANSYMSTLAGRQINVLNKKVFAAFQTLQPYAGGDDLLHGLHLLDIADKHRLILTTGALSHLSADQIHSIDPGIPISGPGIIRNPTDKLVNVTKTFPTRAMRRAAARDKTITYKKPDVQPTFAICFGQGQAFANQPVIEKMTAAASHVEEVTNMLITAYNS